MCGWFSYLCCSYCCCCCSGCCGGNVEDAEDIRKRQKRKQRITELISKQMSGVNNRTTVAVDRQSIVNAASSPSNLLTAELTVMYDIPDKQYRTVNDIIDAHGFQLFSDQVVGSGGAGTVYRGRMKQTNQLVAVKVVNISGKLYENLKTDAKNELFVLQKTSHPYIVKIYSHFIVKDRIRNSIVVYIFMSLAENRSLSEYVRRLDRGMDEPRARRLFAQIVSALSQMHSLGIAHRDLKMGNILLDSDMNAVVTDFGLSRVDFRKSKGGLIMSTKFMGTVPYMAPEILAVKLKLKKLYNPFLADIWSLGIILWLIVNRHYPFGGEIETPKGGPEEHQCLKQVLDRQRRSVQPINRYDPRRQPRSSKILFADCFHTNRTVVYRWANCALIRGLGPKWTQLSRNLVNKLSISFSIN
ncbi:testis-specific serine/threonine-protein kinase 4-like [Oppia nitens]|uniref:testis-specific serine/threonine-protein kinase 4-like n=1 Tax=Oppia nitens TaxID=1686743 RepID=UPI0023DB1059|nr:testis-specific serine/threonine-protein kinase 4-like [Oppia nitens]